MKSAFKFSLITLITFLFSSSAVMARDVILIENKANREEGILLKSILVKKFHLPHELIVLKNITTDCEARSEAIIHLCLLQNGELEVKKINQYVVKNSLGVFLNQDIFEAGVE